MKLNILKIMMLGLITSLFTASCQKEELMGLCDHVLEMSFDNIEVTFHDQCRWFRTASIPAQGCDFASLSEGKYAKYGYVCEISTDDERFEKSAFEDEGKDIYNYVASWGSMNYKSTKSPYKIHFHINANTTGEIRTIKIKYGDNYCGTNLSLIQPPVDQ